MPYRPRELVVRAREAATILLATLDRNEMVARFLDMYAAENRRPGAPISRFSIANSFRRFAGNRFWRRCCELKRRCPPG